MAGCCLTNLGCLSIPIIETTVGGPSGPAGRGISSESYDPANGELTLSFTDATTYTTGDLRGADGADGSNGTPGDNGVVRLYTNTTPASSLLTTTWVTLATYTMPGGTLMNTGDSVIAEVRQSQEATLDKYVLLGQTYIAAPKRRIAINGISCTLYGLNEPTVNNKFPSSLFRTSTEIIRTSNTTATCRVYADFWVGSTPTFSYYETFLTGMDFAASSTIRFDINQFTASESVMRTFTIDKITAA